MAKKRTQFTGKKKPIKGYKYETTYGEKRTFKHGDHYEVEAIRSKRVSTKGPEYFVKWKGWAVETNTWEPLNNLDNVKELICEFELAQDPQADLTFLNGLYIKESEKEKSETSDTKSDVDGLLPIDEPKKIIGIKPGVNYYKDYDDILLKIEWEIRADSGYQPNDTWVSSSEFMRDHLKMLVIFYTSLLAVVKI